jgi:hypothetical protein
MNANKVRMMRKKGYEDYQVERLAMSDKAKGIIMM